MKHTKHIILKPQQRQNITKTKRNPVQKLMLSNLMESSNRKLNIGVISNNDNTTFVLFERQMST